MAHVVRGFVMAHLEHCDQHITIEGILSLCSRGGTGAQSLLSRQPLHGNDSRLRSTHIMDISHSNKQPLQACSVKNMVAVCLSAADITGLAQQLATAWQV